MNENKISELFIGLICDADFQTRFPNNVCNHFTVEDVLKMYGENE